MTDHCCQCHEHQVAFVANISLDELAEKKKKTLSKLNNTSGQHCSLWFFQTSLKKFFEKTPQNQKKNAHRLSSLSLHVNSSTTNNWNSPLPFQVSTPQVTDLAFDEPPTNNCLDFSSDDQIYNSALKTTQRLSNLQQNACLPNELPRLGFSLDDSRCSWTSSLATPSAYTTEDVLVDEDETELQDQLTKPKILARALFSPDKEQSNLDDVHQLSANRSNAFKSCDKKSSAVDTPVSYPNIPFSPVLFEPKDSSATLPKHEPDQCHSHHPLSVSTSLSSGELYSTISNNKLPEEEEEMGCGPVETPVSRRRTDSQLHSILSKKKHFSSTPKHVHFSESSLIVSNCDKNLKNFKSAHKLRQLRDSSEIPTDLTIQSQCLNDDSSALKTISVDKESNNVQCCESDWKKDSFQVEECQPDKDSSPISFNSKKPHDDTLDGESALGKIDPVSHQSHYKPTCKTTPRSPPSSNHESFIHPSPISNSDIKASFPDAASSAISKKGLNHHSRSFTSSGYMSLVSAASENHNLKSLDSERLSSVDSHSNIQNSQIYADSPLNTSINIFDNSQPLHDTKELPKISPQQLNPENPTVSPLNKDDKNPIVFTQLSSSYNEKLISEVDRMSNRDMQEMSAIEPLQIDLCPQTEDNVSEIKESDLDGSTLIIDDETKLNSQDQKDTSDQCSAVIPIDNPSIKKPASSKETITLSKTSLNNSDASTTSSSSTPKVVVSLCGKLRRKSKGFLYPTASQISHTSPLMALNFKVQGKNDYKTDYITKSTVDPLAAVNSDTTGNTTKNNQESDRKNSTEQDLESNTKMLVSKDTECQSTTDKQHEVATLDQLSNKANSPKSSQLDRTVDSPTNSILVESVNKMVEDAKDAFTNCEERQEREVMPDSKDSGHELVHPGIAYQSFPLSNNAISSSNHHSPVNDCQISDCQDIEIHQKNKFYRSQNKPKTSEYEVSKVKLFEISSVQPLNSEPNSEIDKQHATNSDSKIPGISKKMECNQLISTSPVKELAPIPNSMLKQNLKEMGNIIRESVTVQNNQETLELLTASQMVKWEELDNLSEAFIEKDNSSTLNELYSHNGQVCSPDLEAHQGNSEIKPKEGSSGLSGEGKAKEKEIKNDQSTNITSKTQQMPTVCYESHKLLSNKNGNETKDSSPTEVEMTATKRKKENIKCIEMELDNNDLYLSSVNVHFDSPELCFSSQNKKMKHFNESDKGNNGTEDKNDEQEPLAWENQISVKEDTLKNTQNLLNDEVIEVQSLGGFSTAGGKQISVKEESLKKAQNLLNDETTEAQSLGGFSTAKGKQISVKEESLKKAQNLLNDETIEGQSLGGFSMARGKQISVKEESLKKAQNLLNDETIEGQSLGGFSMARGKQISVKEESLKKAQNLLNDETIEAQSLGGVSTARGKQISVNKESLKKAQNLLNDETTEAQSLGGFSTARGKQISVKEESLKKAQNLLNDETIEGQSLGGFSMARGKQISVKEESLKKAQNLLNDETIEGQSLGGFSMARGKQISVKEESLKKAQNLLNDETIEAQSLGGFSMARGKQISVKEENLKMAQNLLNDETTEAQFLEGFSTSKEKRIGMVSDCENESFVDKIDTKLANQANSVHTNNQIGFMTPTTDEENSIKTENKTPRNIDPNFSDKESKISNFKINQNLTIKEKTPTLKNSKKLLKGFRPFKAPRMLSENLTNTKSPQQREYRENEKTEMLKDFNTNSENGDKELQKILQTGGNQIGVKEDRLKKAQNLLNDETSEAQSLGGFSTAKGKQISVKEESLKKAQNLLNDETSEAQSLGGFSTAKGKQISVKEESLKKAQNLLNDETIEAQSLGGFSTARGKQISVKEDSLKKAQNLLNDETTEAKSLGGFSTARGKQISVKEESLKKAQNLLNDETAEAQSLGGFSTARGKQISVKEESLKKAQNLLNDETIEAQSLGGFSTARGKQISVKEDSLKKAQNLLNDEVIEAQSLGGFSTARGKQISVKEESLKKAQNLLNDETIDAQSLGGFSTARGKQISVKEDSLKKAQNLLNDETIDAQSLGGFSTARGKQISVKEDSLKKAQNLLNDETIEAQSLGGFSTARGKQISVKEDSLKKAQNLLSDETIDAQSLGGFSTARGKQISVKEDSLKKAQNLLNDETIEAQSLGGFSTARGKQISVKEDSLKKAQNLLNDETIDAQSLGGFSTARGKQISVKEDSLKKAQNLLNDETIDAQSLGGFSTARGKQISVKEDSLKKAQNLLNDETIEAQSLGGFSTARGKQISVKEDSLKKAQNLLNDETIDAQSLGGFSTARGKQISVKEDSLKKAQNLLNDETIEAQSLGGFSTARGKQISVKEDSLKKAQNLLNDETIDAQSLGGFSTARGKQISVQEDSLKKAQNLLSDETIDAQSLGGFSTARGKQISVKEDSLKKAQNLLNDETIDAQSLGGFSTARGKQISVKEESLTKAQTLLNDETIEAQFLDSFSKANGKQISVKDESLKEAEKFLVESSLEPPIKSVKCLDSFAFQDEDVLVKIVDTMDENVVNDLLSTDFTASQMNGGCLSLSKDPIESDLTSKDNLLPVSTSTAATEVTNNDHHLIEDIFNCSWDDDPSALSNITKRTSSLHPTNKLKRTVSEMSFSESGSTKKKLKIDETEKDRSLCVFSESSELDKPCLLALNTQPGKFSKFQDISDDLLIQSVKIYENQPGADSKIVSEDPKTASGSDSKDSKDQYLNDSDCSNESEMALAVEKLEGEWECSGISGANQSSTDKISNSLNDKVDNSCHNFSPESKKTYKFDSGDTFECSRKKNLPESDLDKTIYKDSVHDKLKEQNKDKHHSYENNFELSNEKFPNDSFGENSINQKKDSATSKICSGFQTCLGQKVLVSNESLQKAVEMLNSTSENRNEDVPPKTCTALQTGLGKKVYVSEKALQETGKTFKKQTHCEEAQIPNKTKPQTFIAFQTALGKDVPISEKSVNKARQVLDEGIPKEDPASSKAKYPRKETPYLVPAVHHKPEDSQCADPDLDNNANSVPSSFLSLQHETKKINLLCQKHTSISWQPSMSVPEEDRSGISPLVTNPVEILSDHRFGSKQNSFSGLISQNPLDQSIQEKTEKAEQDISSKKVDFKTPYRKTPAISEVQETVKVFPRISRPVFRGYRTLPNSPQAEFQKYPNSDLMSSTFCEDLSNRKRQSNRLKDKEFCQKKQVLQESFLCSTDSLSSYVAAAAAPCSKNSTKSGDRHCSTNLLPQKSSVEKSTFHPKSSDGKQLPKEISKTKNAPSLEKTKLGLVPDGSLDKKQLIPETKETSANQIQITNQKETQDISLNAPHFVSSEDSSSVKEKSSRNQENIDKNSESDKQLEASLIESAENLCSIESHFEESHLEQDMIIIRNKRKKILPHAGILTCQKTSRKRIKFSDLLFEGISMSSFLPEQFFAYGVHPNTLAVTSANAIDYRFQLSAFYNVKCLHRIIIGDGAILVPDNKFTAGKEEFFRAFQTIEGVDPKLISPQWFFNHYRWIIWKLAAYEVALPQYFGRRCLCPEMVALQLKFRYDLEIDKCQRSALRRIIERDDSPAKQMVLCVSQINQELNTSAAAPATDQIGINLEVTDGWYATKMFLDCHLSSLISRKKLRIGQKLCISNAELVGTDTASSPLECSENVGLKVSGNCCRPARWDAKLGYQADPRPLCLPLMQVVPDGGLVGCVDIIVARIYPIRYMEKVPGGRSVFRTSRAENKQEQRHEVLQQEAAEKIYNQLQSSFESCFPKQGRKHCKNWNREEIRQLDTGQDLYEAMTCALQPDKLLDCLSETQLVMLADYKRTAEELKAQKMKEEFQKAISNDEHASLKRNVTPLLKVRLIGCSHIDQQHKASTILTIWRPSEDLQQLLEEGQRYHIYNVMPSHARSSFLSGLDVHLTVTRSTHFELLKRHPSIPQDLFHPRKVSSAFELQTKSAQEDRLEVDVTGIVLRITKTVSTNQRKLELLHAVDIEGNILTIRFWGGLQIFSVNDLLVNEVVFSGLNLLLRRPSPQTGTSIALLDVCSEVSHFSLNPHQDYLRDSINQLHKLKASEEFMEKCKKKLDSQLNSEKLSIISPKTPSTSVMSTDNLIIHESDEARKKQKMLQKAKCAKLLSYGSGPSLSPLSIRVPSTVCKAFKAPAITKSKNN